MDADVVVVNHHLFFADMAVKDTGFAELIPTADAYIFDEAHQLSEIASDYFGESVSTKKLVDLINDLRAIYRADIPDMLQLGKTLNRYEKPVLLIYACSLVLMVVVEIGGKCWQVKKFAPHYIMLLVISIFYIKCLNIA